jgi:Ca2+-binding EF-hand superfamily protein
MAGSVHEAKFDRLFDVFDVTRDAHVSREDFESVVERVVTADHGSPNGTRVQAVRDATGRFWAWLEAYGRVDDSGRISREAFRATLEAAFLQAGRFDELLRPAMEAWFDLYDADGDGKISRREYELLQRATGRSTADVDTGFRTIDINGDGYLTLEEFSAILHEFFTSDDRDAPGNWLFGAL